MKNCDSSIFHSAGQRKTKSPRETTSMGNSWDVLCFQAASGSHDRQVNHVENSRLSSFSKAWSGEKPNEKDVIWLLSWSTPCKQAVSTGNISRSFTPRILEIVKYRFWKIAYLSLDFQISQDVIISINELHNVQIVFGAVKWDRYTLND